MDRALRAAAAALALTAATLAAAGCSTREDVSAFPDIGRPIGPAPVVLSAVERDAAIAEMRGLAAGNQKP
jgi:hypothetical protein